jgi:two-component system chemotaxis sensor kinase CheA
MSNSSYEGFLQEFFLDAQERLEEIEAAALKLDSSPSAARGAQLECLRRALHTLKGNSAMMGLTELQSLAHQLETDLKDRKPGDVNVPAFLESLGAIRLAVNTARGSAGGNGEPAENAFAPQPEGVAAGLPAGAPALESARIPFSTLDDMMDLMAETLVLRNQLARAIAGGTSLDPTNEAYRTNSVQAWAEADRAYEALAKTLALTQDRMMQMRMVPLRSLMGSLHRIVYDEGRKEKKSVTLETSGGDTPLDKALLDVCNDALGHLVRNAVVHGIESGKERVAARKPVKGTVRVSAAADADEVVIEVCDDGGGIDPVALERAAQKRGIETQGLDDIISVLFMPGFSTKGEADMSAGRGVGLCAVQEAVRRQGGHIAVSSEPGRSTCFALHVPLSVSITRALLLITDQEEYALPVSSVVASRRLSREDWHHVNHSGVIHWDGEIIPILDLGCGLGTAEEMRSQGFGIVIDALGKRRGLLADRLNGIQEIVVKPLDAFMGTPPGVGGSTILGDGRAVLVLDPRSLASLDTTTVVSA